MKKVIGILRTMQMTNNKVMKAGTLVYTTKFEGRVGFCRFGYTPSNDNFAPNSSSAKELNTYLIQICEYKENNKLIQLVAQVPTRDTEE